MKQKMAMSKQFKINDWTGKTCFKGKTFDSFEDAWEFIYENDPIPEPVEENEAHWFDDYYVVPA